jgi:hypothetical protein
MTFKIGDLVEAVYTDTFIKESTTGIVARFLEDWNGAKVEVIWNEIGSRIELIDDIKRIS